MNKSRKLLDFLVYDLFAQLNSFSISPKINSYNMNCVFQLLHTNYELTFQQDASCYSNFQCETRDNGITPSHEVFHQHMNLQGLGKVSKNSRQQVLRCSMLPQHATITHQCDLLTNSMVRHTNSHARLVQKAFSYILPPKTHFLKNTQRHRAFTMAATKDKTRFVKYE